VNFGVFTFYHGTSVGAGSPKGCKNRHIKWLSWFDLSMSVCVVLVRFVSYFCLSHSMVFVHGFMSMVLWHGFSPLVCLFLPLDIATLSSIIFFWNVLSTTLE